ncbi:MAG: LPS export ABC transporter permease LptF [Methylococcales bacterium]|nr:LPS export ABC transporter permease LptF [Methylococcales bacterium]
MIVQDLLRTMLAVLSVIVVIIVSRKFIRVLDEAIAGKISNDALLSILGYKTLLASVEFLPVALFMAVLMVLGRMYRDEEMAAVSSAGGGAGTLYKAVFLLAFPLSILVVGLSLYVSPWAETQVDKLMAQDQESSGLGGISAGMFTEYSQGDLVFYVEKITTDKTMHRVFVQNRQQAQVGIINAETAQVQDLPDGRYIVFGQGERVQGVPGTLTYVIEQFAEYAVRIESKVSVAKFNRQAFPVDMLWGSSDTHDTAELQRRLAIPLGVLLLTVIAVPLAQITPRGGVYGNMLVGFLIYFSYGNFLRVSQSWVINGTIPGWLGLSGINLLLLLAGSILVARLYGWRWLLMKITGKVA